MAERELGWRGGGWRWLLRPVILERGPVGPRVLGALPSHRHLVDAQVSCLRSRSGDFGRQAASVEERLEKKLEHENSVDFWRCVRMGVGGQQQLTGDPNRGVTETITGQPSRNLKISLSTSF